MQGIARVKLSDGKNEVTIVGGKEKNPSYGINDNRKYREGLSVFFNGEYILSFVVLPEERKQLISKNVFKAINDLGFQLFTWNYNMKILEEDGDAPDKCNFEEIVKRSGCTSNTAWAGKHYVNEIWFTGNNEKSFSDAIAYALKNPVRGNNLWHSLDFLGNDMNKIEEAWF
jgi:hypothetical protein